MSLSLSRIEKQIAGIKTALQSAKTDCVLTSQELGDAVGLRKEAIRHHNLELQAAGLAERKGREWRYSPKAIEYLQTRPETRGRKGVISKQQ